VKKVKMMMLIALNITTTISVVAIINLQVL